MAEVHLRPITGANFAECVALGVTEVQAKFIAPNAKSLSQATGNSALYPLAIYDVSERGHEEPPVNMVGFAMYELVAGVGFIARLMIDERHQCKGYGKAAMREVIRRLHLYPDVEMIGTSYRRGNEAAARLYEGLGFVPWDIEFPEQDTDEIFVRLK